MPPVYQPPVPFSQNISVGAAGGPFAGYQVTDANLTSAQILALQTTPVALVAAPGVGFTITPHLAIVRFIAGSIAYTNAGGAMSLTVGGTNGLNQTLASSFITAVSPNYTNEVVNFAGVGIAAGGNPPANENAALQITKATNQFLAGNGTAHVTMYYTIEPTK